MNTTKKVTKKVCYSTIAELVKYAESQGVGLPDGVTYDGLNEFVDHEIELLDKKAAAAAERAANKKVEGDALREKVLSVVTDKFQTVTEITNAVSDPEVSPAMVTARLSQLAKNGQVVREQQTFSGEGKSRKLSVYKLA